MRWSANFYSYFEKKEYTLEVNANGHVLVTKEMKKDDKNKMGWTIIIENGKRIQKIEWDVFKDSDEFKVDISSRHKHIQDDVLLATRNFQHRVETFKKEVIFGSNNKMKVRHISYRVEFQGRGAGHIHGVIWVDLEEVTKYMKDDMNEITINELELTGTHVNSETLLVDAYEKLRKKEKVTNPEKKALEKFADNFCTCTLCPQLVGERVKNIAKQVNKHGHSKSCKKSKPNCRWRYPKFPLKETMFIDKEREWKDEEKLTEERRNSILNRVKNVLVDEQDGKEVISPNVDKIMDKVPKDKNFKDDMNKKQVMQQHKKNIEERIKLILEEAGQHEDEIIEYEEYRKAVEQQPEKSCWIHLQRDIDEIFINNYNPEWLEAWDSNIDISLVSDFYGAITYVTDYWTKDSTGMTDVLSTAMKQLNKDDEMKKKCHELANTFISHRQIGEAEAYYKLFPHMNLTYSSVATTYIPTVAESERRRFLMKQDPGAGKGFPVKDRVGLFLEKPDMVSKYMRRMIAKNKKSEEDEDTAEEEEDEQSEDAKKAVEQISYAQFAKM